jgi:hypothetical protein
MGRECSIHGEEECLYDFVGKPEGNIGWRIILSRDVVTTDGVFIGHWIY